MSIASTWDEKLRNLDVSVLLTKHVFIRPEDLRALVDDALELESRLILLAETHDRLARLEAELQRLRGEATRTEDALKACMDGAIATARELEKTRAERNEIARVLEHKNKALREEKERWGDERAAHEKTREELERLKLDAHREARFLLEGTIHALKDERNAERTRVARLRDALEGVLVADKQGKLHAPECIGLHGYGCKAWCSSAVEALADTDAGGES